MIKKYFLTGLILLQFFIISFGQKGYKPGYIITNDFDTLRGFIKLKSNFQNSGICNFIEGKYQTPENYSPYDIKAYRIENSKYYLSKDIVIDSSKQRVFLEYLIDGIVDLYYYKDPWNEYYFIEKDTLLIPISNEGSMVTVKGKGGQGEYETNYFRNSNQYKRILAYLFQESPEVLKEIPNTPFDYRPLMKITTDYHNSVCKDYKCIDFTKSTSKSLYLEPYIGIINSWMGLKTSKDYVYDSKPYLGLQLRLEPFKGYSMWNLLVGLNYSSNKFLGDFDNTLYTADYIRTYRIFTRYSIIRIPLTIEYSLPTEKIQPFISMSYNNTFLLNKDYDVTRINILYTYQEKTYFRSYQFGASLGLGLRFHLKSNSYFYLKNELEYRIPGANFNYVLDYQKVYTWLINFGYGFKIK